MDAVHSSKKKWELTPEAFDKLLASLNADREKAGEEYERLRNKLLTFFENRGSLRAEDHVDETFNRAARRLAEGATIHADKPSSYFYAIARNVISEYWESSQRQALPIEEEPKQAPVDEDEEDLERLRRDQMYECQKQCVEELPRESRELVIGYYQEEPGVKMKKKREQLAKQLEMTPNALRIKACRIRDKLDACVENCFNASSGA